MDANSFMNGDGDGGSGSGNGVTCNRERESSDGECFGGVKPRG